MEDEAVAAIAARHPQRLLDAGCGTGDVTRRVRDEAEVEVIGLDLSFRMIELTRARGIVAQVGTIESLPCADDAFDCVLANRVLYHLADLSAGLSEIERVLQPRGFLVAVTHSDDHLEELWSLLPQAARPRLRFSAENGFHVLRSVFTHVQRRDVTGIARFVSTGAVRGYFDSYRELATLSQQEVDQCLRQIALPFDATYHHSMFIASHLPAEERGSSSD